MYVGSGRRKRFCKDINSKQASTTEILNALSYTMVSSVFKGDPSLNKQLIVINI
jgi:hypothetical protein